MTFLFLKEITASNKTLYGLDYFGVVWKFVPGKKGELDIWVRVINFGIGGEKE